MTGSGHGRPERGVPWVDAGDDPAMESLDSARTKLVALCLARERSATLSELNALLGEPRCTLLRILGELADRGLVERVEGTYHFLGAEDEPDPGAADGDVAGASDAGESDAGTADDVASTPEAAAAEAADATDAGTADGASAVDADATDDAGTGTASADASSGAEIAGSGARGER